MLRYDGRGFTRVEDDYSKPWLPGESRPEATPGEDYSRPWFPGEANNHHQRVTVATDRSVHPPTVIETHAMPTKSENNQDQRSTGEHASTLQRTTGSYWLQRAPALSDISPSPKQFQAINNHRKDESEGPQGLAELEEEALIYLDDETGAKAEIEATDAYHLSGNEEPPSVKL
ncbi:hypothetical protein BKA60DRAFT_473434 [Fusarium oxysporum]|nr:hypothetical protein BKA60DRAFT_473434 [Fusarium oxysporum]